MENTKPTPVTNKGSNNKVLILAALIVLFIATLAYGYYQNKNSKNSPAANSSEWAEFKSEKYGFKFDYPKEWGAPQVIVNEKIPTYTLNFPEKQRRTTTNKSTLVLYMEPNDKTVVTEAYVKDLIKSSPAEAAAYDSSSYSKLIYFPEQSVQGLSIYQIIDLPKIKVSAVTLNYKIINATGCPLNQFSDISSCIKKSDFDVLKKIAKNLKSI